MLLSDYKGYKIRIADKSLLKLVQATDSTTAIVFLILAKREKGDIYACDSLFEKYNISRHKAFMSITKLQKLGLLSLKYSFTNKREILIKRNFIEILEEQQNEQL